MSEIETSPVIQPEILIESIHEGQCPSISGRSTLSYAIGRDPEGALHLRIVGNSGGGMFCDEWAPASAIDEVVHGATALTSRSFDVLHPGRSINTAGFVLAVLRHLGLIRVSAENTRVHEPVPTETFEKVAGVSKKPKAQKVKPKDAA